MTADWLAGRWIRQYQLLEPLGGGSFGTVYRAQHRDLKIDRAFKVLREALSQDPRCAPASSRRPRRRPT